MQKLRESLFKEPMIVARNGESVIFMERDDALARPLDIMANAQLYDSGQDAFSPLVPLGVFPKFMSYMEMVDPPQPFVRPNRA